MFLKKNQNLSQAGFSLIELMVVVAIIGILASFAIPQYQSFQTRARQKEGVTLLSSYYTGAQATFVEVGHYPGNFPATGFSPAGTIHYRIQALNNAAALPSGFPSEAACISTAAACTAIANFKNWVEDTTTASFRAENSATAATNSGVAFLTTAAATIRANGPIDTWTVNQLKQLVNVNPGH